MKCPLKPGEVFCRDVPETVRSDRSVRSGSPDRVLYVEIRQESPDAQSKQPCSSLSLSLSLSLSPNIYRYIVLIDVLIDMRIIHKSKGILISFINVLFIEHNLLLWGRGEFDCWREQLLSPVLSCIHLHVVVYHLKCLLLNYYDVALISYLIVHNYVTLQFFFDL